MSRFGFKIDGDTLENNYKEHLSGFREWDQLAHADNWLLLVENMGEHMNIDECMHARDLFTFVSNKDGHGKKVTLAAAVRGTKASVAVEVLMRIPEEKRLAVKEVTIVIDCFHVMKNHCDALDSIRMKLKRKYQYMAKDKDGRDVFLADSGYVLSMAQEDFKHIKFHFTSEF